ncbi:transglycosylase SLT domain-containing protein [Halotalea alkalilenta]|uniref:transglycosylase SLT domain-containing protein n=1 Tax=Halotalea alkalilenta TaxID=376489 RepID=UPI000A68938B|nr:transglycosylase SLT domain-containing protein [Halotalea alkalilenta]
MSRTPPAPPSPLRHLLGLGIATALCAGLLAPHPAQADDMAMRQALADARQGSWSRIDQRTDRVDHLLDGYIEYHRLRHALPDVAPQSINDFIARHDDSPLAGWLRGLAQTAYGRAGNFAALLAVSDGEPIGTERQCYYYTALLEREPSAAAAGGRALWRVGSSQPNACDPLFQRLRASGALTTEDDWTRLMLAWENGSTGLVNHLRRLIDDPAWRDALNAFDRVNADPSQVATLPARLGPDGSAGPSLLAATFHRLTRDNTAAALAAWQRLGEQATLDAEQRRSIEHDLAFYAMARGVPGSQPWVDRALPRLEADDLYELRVRNALAARDWQAVFDWVPKMPDSVRTESRWQYWLGRASTELGDPTTARSAFEAAAQGRNFFAFAAADRLGRPYALNDASRPVPPERIAQVAQTPAVQRVAALYRIDEPGLARSEWVALLERSDHAHSEAMAAYAIQQGWYELAVQASISARAWDALAWRFPHAFEPEFVKWGASRGVDPYFLMGIARRESAFNQRAQSPVGARGLMQLMPDTARHLSSRRNIPYAGVESLEDPEVNVAFGSAYIRDMLDRYSNNRIAAAAAYNAGPGRVDRWLANGNQPFDLFVESIPFRETREYVLAVLAYRAIFESLAKGSSEGVKMLSDAERNAYYDASMRSG